MSKKVSNESLLSKFPLYYESIESDTSFKSLRKLSRSRADHHSRPLTHRSNNNRLSLFVERVAMGFVRKSKEFLAWWK